MIKVKTIKIFILESKYKEVKIIAVRAGKEVVSLKGIINEAIDDYIAKHKGDR